MTKLKITTGLMGILLVSMLVISCGGGGTGKKSKEAEETEKLVDEQKKLVEDFKQKYKLTPDQANKFEEKLTEEKTEAKNKGNTEDLDRYINILQSNINNVRIIESNDPQAIKALIDQVNQRLVALGLKSIRSTDELKSEILSGLNSVISLKIIPGFSFKDFNILIKLIQF
jgi:hypothetical protein